MDNSRSIFQTNLSSRLFQGLNKSESPKPKPVPQSIFGPFNEDTVRPIDGFKVDYTSRIPELIARFNARREAAARSGYSLGASATDWEFGMEDGVITADDVREICEGPLTSASRSRAGHQIRDWESQLRASPSHEWLGTPPNFSVPLTSFYYFAVTLL
ncbi:hypothetical protein BJ508DRAFT_335988 [Ascobolus immersus RN42]|uniref:Uncharacterized protein n=1 Tax=Ascobolus immersus RN42 TaxID=1160509 RepID=A0A3N4HE50_ASCIM|nr:hypothetical protein BJ508DRAFT_335988 [Ascobolus immersus RN42]